jgi:hypothetical protein
MCFVATYLHTGLEGGFVLNFESCLFFQNSNPKGFKFFKIKKEEEDYGNQEN